MSLDDWILALHLLAAFVLVAGIIGFWAMIAAVWSVATPGGVRSVLRLSPLFNAAAAAGAGLTLVFGVWLAISLDAYRPWDGWVVAAIVLWVVASAAGQRADVEFARARGRARERLRAGDDGPDGELRALVRTRRGLAMHTIASVAAILVLADMIWKPGA